MYICDFLCQFACLAFHPLSHSVHIFFVLQIYTCNWKCCLNFVLWLFRFLPHSIHWHHVLCYSYYLLMCVWNNDKYLKYLDFYPEFTCIHIAQKVYMHHVVETHTVNNDNWFIFMYLPGVSAKLKNDWLIMLKNEFIHLYICFPSFTYRSHS